MKRAVFLLTFALLFSLITETNAQKPRTKPGIKPVVPKIVDEEGSKATVIDDRLSVLLDSPSLFARPIQRMRIGRSIMITGEKKADGVSFYKISSSPASSGWIQSEAVVNSFRKGEDLRIVKLIQSSEGFEKIQRMKIFLDSFPDSELRPAVLLLFGDLMENFALGVTKRADKSLDTSEMAASGAPLHSFYLSYRYLDRYRKLNIGFLFNVETKTIHYDGSSWQEIVEKFPKANELNEAEKRLKELKEQMKIAPKK